MKIKDIIKKLESFDGEMQVRFMSTIESHRSVSVCGNADVSIDVDGDEVVVNVNGEETDSD